MKKNKIIIVALFSLALIQCKSVEATKSTSASTSTGTASTAKPSDSIPKYPTAIMSKRPIIN